MATERLRVLLEMSASQYKREAHSAASATGEISESVEGTTTRMGRLKDGMSNIGTVAKVAIAGAATAAVLSFSRDAVRASTDLEESINAVQVTFGEAADGILALGENAADSFGLANSEFNAFAVQFSSFAQKIAGSEGRSVVDVMGEMTGRISDFASVMNIEVADAAEKFQSGLAGQTEPLRAFGIDVSAAAVNQKALELGLAETSSELTEQDKILGRYRLIMEQTDKTAGDFKNTQDGLANSTKTLAANFEDFKARAGEELTPALADLINQGIQLFDILDPDVDLGWTQRLSAGLQLILGEGAEAVESYVDQKVALNELGNQVDLTDEAYRGRFSPALRDAGDAGNEAADGIDEATNAAGEAQEAANDAAEAQRNLRRSFLELADPIFAANDALGRLRDAQDRLIEVQEDSESSAADVAEALLDVAEASLDAQGALEELGDGNLTEGIARIAEALGISDEAARILLETLGLLDGMTIETVVNTRFTTSGAGPVVVTNQTGKYVPKALGGPVMAGQTYLVGERGPELFKPNESGEIVPNQALTQMGKQLAASYNKNLSINLNGPVNGVDEVMSAVQRAAGLVAMVDLAEVNPR